MAIKDHLPFGNAIARALSRIYISKLAPEEQAKYFEHYKDYMGIGKNVSFNKDLYKNFAESNLKALDEFKELKEEDKEKLKKVLDNVSGNLKISEKQKEYEQEIAAFSELIKGIPQKYKPADLIHLLDEINTAAKKEIVAYQEALKKEKGMEPILTNPKAKQALKTIQDKQITELDNAIAESKNALTKAAQQGVEESLFIAYLQETNKKNKEAFGKKQPPLEGQGLQVKETAHHRNISGIRLQDLDSFETLTGRQATKESDGSWSITFPRFGLLYYNDPRHNEVIDMAILAKTAKILNYKKILHESENFTDPEEANEMAKQAFEAYCCAEVGYKLEDITMMVNGNKVKAEDLFKDEPQRLNELRKSSKRNIEKTVSTPQLSSTMEGISNAKEALKGIKAKQNTLEIPEDKKEEEEFNPNPHK